MKLKKLNKKTILIAAAALVVLAGLIVGVCVLANRKPQFYAVDQPDAKESAVTLLADHGLSVLAPANTAPAFVQAGQNGYDGVRFAPRRTADGVWVVLEKENIRSVTDGRGRIGELTYKQLLRHRVNKGKGLKAFRDNPLTVPTLAQALSVCSQYGMTPVIEVTANEADELEALFQAVGSRYKKPCCFLFSDGELLAKAKELLESGTPLKAKNVSLSLWAKKLDKQTLETARQNPGVTVFFPADQSSAKQAARFTEAGLTLCACGVNKPKQFEKLTAAGVTMFLTDRLSHQPIEPEKDETTTAAAGMTAPRTKQNEGASDQAAPTKKAAEKATQKAAATKKAAEKATQKAVATKKAAEKTTKKAAAAAKPTEKTTAQ